MTLVLLILALASFILALFNVPKINWVALGLALITISLILPLIGVGA